MTERDSQAARRELRRDLDTIARLAVDAHTAARLRDARRAALARLAAADARVSAHWINWAPVGFALILAVVTSWSLLADSGQSLDAEILADTLPVDAYLDAGFEASVERGGVELIEN